MIKEKVRTLGYLTALAVGALIAGHGVGWSLAATATPASAATQPASTPPPSGASQLAALAQFRLRANQDMANGDYAGALPLLEKVSQMLTDQPDQLGPVLEDIRRCRRLMNSATKPSTGLTITAAPSEARTPHVRPAATELLNLPIKDLGNFDFDSSAGGNIPDDVKHLDGVKFRTTGYMIPLDQAESISEFALVPSLFACCFGQPPQVQHTIVVHTPKGKALNYFPDELVVEGTLHVEEQKDGGFIVSIFQIDASSVRPAPK